MPRFERTLKPIAPCKLPMGALKGWGDYCDSGEYWYEYFLFPPEIPDDSIKAQFYEHYSGPGLAYAHRPHIQRTHTRTLVRQHGGLDI